MAEELLKLDADLVTAKLVFFAEMQRFEIEGGHEGCSLLARDAHGSTESWIRGQEANLIECVISL